MTLAEKTKVFVDSLQEKKDGEKCCLFCKHWTCPMLLAWREIVGIIADTTFSCTEYKEVVYRVVEDGDKQRCFSGGE